MIYKLTSDTWDQKEYKAIQKVIKSNIFTMGKNVKKFEENFAKYLNRKYAVMTNSGSSANLIGIASFFFKKNKPLKKGDEVIVPAISWSTTYSPLQQYGLKLKFVDVELNTLNIDLNKIKKAITKRTRVICCVNVLGCPANLLEIKKLCKKRNILLYEDNCESLGAEINGMKTGSFGDFSTHSFFYSHHISTMEGGMVVTDDFEIYNLLKSLRAHGWTRELGRNIKNNNFYEDFKFILPGYNLRPTEISGAIGLEQLKKITKMVNIRSKNQLLFKKLFADDSRFIIQKTKHKHSGFALSIIIKNNKNNFKEKIFRKLKKNNIEFRLIIGGCFTEQKYHKFFNYKVFNKLTNAKKIHYDGFYVGNASKDLSQNIKKLHKILLQI